MNGHQHKHGHTNGHSHTHSHDHAFGQDQRRTGETKTLIVIAITFIMMLVEISTGILFGSMALLADGIHMASHAVALGITAFAYIYARKHAYDSRFSFGTGKVNALGGYSGAILLALFAFLMAWESIERLFFPTEIAFNQAIFVALIGLIVNGASVLILGDNHSHGHDHRHGHDHGLDEQHRPEEGHGHHHHDHNLRSAYLHVMADALTSVTAIIALLTAKYFGWVWMDPLMGIVGSLLVGRWSIGLLGQTSRTLLDHQAPGSITNQIRHEIEDHGGVVITDLHVWSIGPGIYSVILSLKGEKLRPPEAYREMLDPHLFPHVTVEVQPSKKDP